MWPAFLLGNWREKRLEKLNYGPNTGMEGRIGAQKLLEE